MSVRKRKHRWHYDFQIRSVRHRGAIPEARNKAQAERAEAKLKLDLFEQRFGDGISKNFAEFIAEVYEPAAKSKRSYHTAENLHIRTVTAHFKTYALADISPMAVERFKRERLATPVQSSGKPRTPATVNRELGVLSQILAMACDNGLLQSNPCSKVRRLREDNTRTRYLTEAEEEQLMTAITKPYERLRPLIILALNTGMRQGEIVNLTWPQVDWRRNLIIVTNTKSGDDRTIPMNETVKDLLVRRWRESDQLNAKVFQISADVVCTTFHRLAQRAKLIDFRFHDLRHTFATRLAPHTDVFTLAALLGHKTLAMTARYTHPTDDGKRRAIAVLNALARKAGQENVTIDFPAQVSKAG
jgi:integrase